MMKKFLKLLLSFIGVGSVSLAADSCVAMYACPYSDFLLKGVVSDSGSNPIQGIKVNLAIQGSESDELYQVTEPSYTDETGTIRFHDSYSSIYRGDNYFIVLEDVDGELNGEFKSKSIPATIIKTKDGKGWCEGNFECTFKAELEKVEK